MDWILNELKNGRSYITAFITWLLFAFSIGIICGLCGTFFYESITFVTNLRIKYNYLLLFLPTAGLLIILLYHACKVQHDKGTNLVLDSIQAHEQIPGNMAPLIYAGTVITHMFGGSAGREGAAIQMGGCIGVYIGKHFKMTEKDINILTMCGMSAVFSAMFGTPLTATIFSMEVISIGMFQYSAFVPCIIASTTSYAIAGKFHVYGEKFTINSIPSISLVVCAKIILFAILCGIVAIVFCQAMHSAHKIYAHLIKNQYIRIFVGGCIVLGSTIIIGSQYFCGAGFNIIADAFSHNVHWWTFIVKILLTALTLGCGYKGGEIVPALCVGAAFGSILAVPFGIDVTFSTALGMVCMFCGVVNCPITSILLAIEMFGRHDIILFCIAIGVSYVFSGSFGLYKSQRILYSKLHAEFINIHSH